MLARPLIWKLATAGVRDEKASYSGEAQCDCAESPQQSRNTTSISLLTASQENSRCIQHRPCFPIVLKGKARICRIAAARLWASFSTHRPH